MRSDIKHSCFMDTYVDERDYKLLETDKYTFFVLKKIMGGECNLLLSDHERLILCFTGHPFPVWIWTSDDAAEEEMEKAQAVMNTASKQYRHFLVLEEELNRFVPSPKRLPLIVAPIAASVVGNMSNVVYSLCLSFTGLTAGLIMFV